MRLHLGMRAFSSSQRPFRILGTTLGGAALLGGALVGCGPTEEPSSSGGIEEAVDKLTTQQSVTVVTRLDGTAREVRTFLAETGGARSGDGAPSPEAELLSRAEFTLALGAPEEHQSLNELKDTSETVLATSLGFGAQDVLAYKSIDGKVYLRLRVRQAAKLAGQVGVPEKDRRTLKDIAALADDLPGSLRPAKDVLKGRWVRVEPGDFKDFGWAKEMATGGSAAGGDSGGGGGIGVPGGLAGEALSALDGEELRDLLEGLEKVLVEHATFDGAGDGKSGTRRMTAAIPAREAATELAPTLKALGVRIDPAEVTERKITAEVTVRRGVLAALSIDLGRLTGGSEAARLPLRLEFGSGDALSMNAPAKAKKLDPQDVLAAILYATMNGRGR